MSQQNPKWLVGKAPRDLKTQISIAVSDGYIVTSQTRTTAQLTRKKHFSILGALIFQIFYLIYYLADQDVSIFLDVKTQPSKEVLDEEIKKQKDREAHFNRDLLTNFSILIGVLVSIVLFAWLYISLLNFVSGFL